MVKVIENRLVSVEVGSVVENQSGRVERLLLCEWDGAAFRFPHHVSDFPSQAVNVEITGRTFQRRTGGDYWVKAQIEWVGDGEPSRFSSAWLKACPFNSPVA